MKKIVKYIQGLAKDKKDHYILGVFYSLFVMFGALFGVIGASLGLGFALFLVLAKEIYLDWYKKQGTPELMDFIVNMVAPTITYLTFIITIC